MKFFFILFFIYNLSISSLIAKKIGCSLKDSGWPSNLKENIKFLSNSTVCIDKNFCRSWEEIKNVAYCKISKLSTILPKRYSIYYVSTLYKTVSQHEWNKFIYGFVNKITNTTTYLKLCIPVDRKKTAWLDDRCPLDQCREFGGIVGNCESNQNEQEVSLEVLSDNGKEFKKSKN